MPNSTPNETSSGGNAPDVPQGKSLGMGGEAVENVHAAQQSERGRTPDAGAASQQNAAESGDGGDDGRAGSEPLGRQREHVPSYGGTAGAPRTSADQREPDDPTGGAGR